LDFPSADAWEAPPDAPSGAEALDAACGAVQQAQPATSSVRLALHRILIMFRFLDGGFATRPNRAGMITRRRELERAPARR
jgi:hypothetical protein